MCHPSRGRWYRNWLIQGLDDVTKDLGAFHVFTCPFCFHDGRHSSRHHSLKQRDSQIEWHFFLVRMHTSVCCVLYIKLKDTFPPRSSSSPSRLLLGPHSSFRFHHNPSLNQPLAGGNLLYLVWIWQVMGVDALSVMEEGTFIP